ncbi:Putative protein of unknown function [Podospora comata]|uniref:Uncharacterized protein n=1 Tax=Podospora comata TaxID=48703 RepID=A0ABY6S1T6_PODCO|nr:Putative protein of unknown function [Podospora comata]
MPSLFSSYICSPYSFDFKASTMALGTLFLHLLVPLFQRSRPGLTNSFGIPSLKFANTFIDSIITSAYTLFQNILRACECLQRFVPSSSLPTGQHPTLSPSPPLAFNLYPPTRSTMAMEPHAKAQAEGDKPLAWDKLTDWGRRRYLTAAKKMIGQEKRKAAIAEQNARRARRTTLWPRGLGAVDPGLSNGNFGGVEGEQLAQAGEESVDLSLGLEDLQAPVASHFEERMGTSDPYGLGVLEGI